MEAKVAVTLAELMRREYGLSPTEVRAALQSSVLTVRLKNAVSPLGRVVLQEEDGAEILQSVYAILHDIHHDRLNALVSGIVGRAARCRSLEPEAVTDDVLLVFQLGEPAGKIST